MLGGCVIKIISAWVYCAAIGAAVAAVGVQQVRISNLKSELAEEQKARSDENSVRMKAALDHKGQIKKLAEKHAEDQQRKEDHYAAQIKKLEADKRAGAVLAGQLRDKLAAVTASSVRPGETHAAAYERAAGRLELVGGLLAEGIDLVTESRAIIRQRDVEVASLLEQIRIDRAACSAVDR